MPDALRIAVLGFWHVHAADYAREAQEHPDTEIVAVWDDDESLGRPGAERFGVPYVATLDEILARDDVDAVTVTTETARHHEVMTRAAAAGKHLFTEKVLAPTVDEAEAIVAAADAARCPARRLPAAARTHGYTQAITDILETGSLGRLRLRAGAAVARRRRAAGRWPGLAARALLRPRGGDRRRPHRPRLPPRLPRPAVPRARCRVRSRDLSLGLRARGRGPRRRDGATRAARSASSRPASSTGRRSSSRSAGRSARSATPIDRRAIVSIGAAFGGRGPHELPVPARRPGSVRSAGSSTSGPASAPTTTSLARSSSPGSSWPPTGRRPRAGRSRTAA